MKSSSLNEVLLTKYPKGLLSKKEAGNELRSSESTVDRLRKTGVLKEKMIGGRVFFTTSTIADYVCAD